MKVFNSNNPDGAAIQRDDEEFFAAVITLGALRYNRARAFAVIGHRAVGTLTYSFC
jgi:hypothetical protein